jgi:pimeloyl-ACP methyl ester carboxylesterase
MDYLAANGLDVFTFDMRGFARSERPRDPASVTSETCVRDIGAVVDFVCASTGVRQVDLLGWSLGGITASLYAARNPHLVRRLFLYAGGAESRDRFDATPVPEPAYEAHSRESIVARLAPEFAIEEAQEAFVTAALRWNGFPAATGRRIAAPDGGRIRAAAEDIRVPTLMLYGDRDGAYRPEVLLDFFSKLNTTDKALVVVPNASHFLIIEKQYMRLFTAIAQWFGYD